MPAKRGFRMCGTGITSSRQSRAAQRVRAAGGRQLDPHGEEAGRRQPQAPASIQWELKRSLSTAYYALFHAVAKEAADLFAGAGPVRAGKAGDTPKHGFAKNACREVPKLGFPRHRILCRRVLGAAGGSA